MMNQLETTSASPLVSVIVPACNAEAYIEATLNSVLSQTYRNLEVIVVDDGSRDRTAEIVHCICHGDSRVTLIRQPNSGVAAARNRAIEHSHGEFIAPIDADDVWHPENMGKQVSSMLRGGGSTGLVYSWSAIIDGEGSPTGEFLASAIEGRVYAALLGHNFIGNASACLIRRVCFDQVGGYDVRYREHGAQGCEDWDLYLRIARHYPFRVVKEFLVGYRKAGNSMSCDHHSMAKSLCLMLESIRHGRSDIPDVVCRFALVRLCVYFADQSLRSRSRQEALYWLRMAFRTDPVMVFTNCRFYGLLRRGRPRPPDPPRAVAGGTEERREKKDEWSSRHEHCAGRLHDLRDERVRVKFTVLKSRIMQYLMNVLVSHHPVPRDETDERSILFHGRRVS